MSKNSQFEKFINKTRGSAIKEQFKQEKKIAKKDTVTTRPPSEKDNGDKKIPN